MTPTLQVRPKFLSLYFQDLKEGYEDKGPASLIPFWIILFGAAGWGIAYYVPTAFFIQDHWDISTAVYGTLLAFNGLILALSWQAFSRIQSSICSPGFSAFLREKGLTSGYFFLIDYIQLTQVVGILASAAGLVTVILPNLSLMADRVILAVAIAASAYAVRQGTGAVTMMHDLIWSHSIFDEAQQKAPGNVTQFPGRSVV